MLLDVAFVVSPPPIPPSIMLKLILKYVCCMPALLLFKVLQVTLDIVFQSVVCLLM